MEASGIPAKFQLVWGADAGASYIRTIPVASQIGITAGAASFTDGFPPVCFSPVSAGGVPPFGQDFNGVLNAVTAWNQWQQAGGPIKYDATFQSEVGGYPQGCVVSSATTLGTFWMATVDNNVTNPDTGGAGWNKIIGPTGVTAGTYTLPTMTVQSDGRVSSIGSATNINVSGSIVAGNNMAVTGSLTISNGTVEGGWQCYTPPQWTAGNAVMVSSVAVQAGEAGYTISVPGYVLTSSGVQTFSAPYGNQFSYVGDGNAQALGFFATSDARTKTDVEDISPEDGLRFVDVVDPKTYMRDGNKGAGYIAQELLAKGYQHLTGATPGVGLEAEDHTFGDVTIQSPKDVKLIAKYDDMIAYLHAALRGVVEQNRALSARLSALEN